MGPLIQHPLRRHRRVHPAGALFSALDDVKHRSGGTSPAGGDTRIDQVGLVAKHRSGDARSPVALARMFLGCLCLIAGCGPGLPETVPVSGRVTLNGGAWPKPGMLFFTPVEEVTGYPMRPATAAFSVDGAFASATTYNPGDGLLPGKYHVRVECWEQEPNMEGKPVKSHVPRKYQDAATSGFEVKLDPADGPKVLTFDVTTPE